jgi:hypothetical protein
MIIIKLTLVKIHHLTCHNSAYSLSAAQLLTQADPQWLLACCLLYDCRKGQAQLYVITNMKCNED